MIPTRTTSPALRHIPVVIQRGIAAPTITEKRQRQRVRRLVALSSGVQLREPREALLSQALDEMRTQPASVQLQVARVLTGGQRRCEGDGVDAAVVVVVLLVAGHVEDGEVIGGAPGQAADAVDDVRFVFE